jgi:hypothetical protein
VEKEQVFEQNFSRATIFLPKDFFSAREPRAFKK